MHYDYEIQKTKILQPYRVTDDASLPYYTRFFVVRKECGGNFGGKEEKREKDELFSKSVC